MLHSVLTGCVQLDYSPYVRMEVAELLVFDSALDAANTSAVEEYLRVKHTGMAGCCDRARCSDGH